MIFRFELWHFGKIAEVFKTQDYDEARKFFTRYFWDMGYYTKTFIDGKYYKMQEAKKYLNIKK